MKKRKLRVLLDTSPLGNGHSARGVGIYTRLLAQYLSLVGEVELITKGEPFSWRDVDLIHYPFFDLFFATLPLWPKRPTVVTIHDVIPLVFSEHYRPGKRGKIRFFYQKVALSRVKAVVTDSLASKRDIEKYLGVPPAKITVVPLAANPRFSARDQKEVNRVRRRYGLPKNYLLYVGDINYNKNLPQLIKALKFLPYQIKLVCVGKNFRPQAIPEWQWIETQLALSNVEARVKFINDLPVEAEDDLAAIYSGALAYVQPSLYEGFGLPVLEAMRCRTPVIAAKNSSLLEVGGKTTLFVEPEAEAIAQAATEIFSWSKTKRRQWGRQAYKWSQQYSWQRTARETAAVYRRVVGD